MCFKCFGTGHMARACTDTQPLIARTAVLKRHGVDVGNPRDILFVETSAPATSPSAVHNSNAVTVCSSRRVKLL